MIMKIDKIKEIPATDFRDDIAKALGEITQEAIVVTVVSTIDCEEIWAEAEIEKADVLNWIDEISRSCKIRLIHFFIKETQNKTWRVI